MKKYVNTKVIYYTELTSDIVKEFDVIILQRLGTITIIDKDEVNNIIDIIETNKNIKKFIYIMDAYEDLSEDKKKNRYNPLKQISEKEDYEERMVQILRMMIAESTARFEQLPCLVDVDILRNILYDGVWNRYNQIQSRIQEQNQEQMKKSKKSEEKK